VVNPIIIQVLHLHEVALHVTLIAGAGSQRLGRVNLWRLSCMTDFDSQARRPAKKRARVSEMICGYRFYLLCGCWIFPHLGVFYECNAGNVCCSVTSQLKLRLLRNEMACGGRWLCWIKWYGVGVERTSHEVYSSTTGKLLCFGIERRTKYRRWAWDKRRRRWVEARSRHYVAVLGQGRCWDIEVGDVET
jgi:hypothetical protein